MNIMSTDDHAREDQMGDFDGLGANEAKDMEAALRRMGLVAPTEHPRMRPLTGGVSSIILRVDTATSAFCVKRALEKLKVVADWRAPVSRSLAEVAWMKVAARITPGSVPPILGEDPQTFSFAMAFLDPADHPVWKTQLLGGFAAPSFAAAVAARLVDIHAATADDAATERQFGDGTVFRELRLDPYFGATALVHRDCADALNQLIQRTAATRRALVHGDISPKNILVGPDGPVLLDAECACYGDPAFDVAFCLTHLFLKCVHRPAMAQDCLACVDSFWGAYAGRVGWEPIDGLEARVVSLLAGLMLARIDGKSPVEYLTDEGDRNLVRTFARQAVLNPPSRLSDYGRNWSEHLSK